MLAISTNQKHFGTQTLSSCQFLCFGFGIIGSTTRRQALMKTKMKLLMLRK